MSLTGSLIVFGGDIENALRPHWVPKSQARPHAIATAALENIHRQWPDATIRSLNLPVHAGATYEFSVLIDDVRTHVYTDADSGEVLGSYDLAWLNWIVDLHHNLHLGPVGKQLVGAVGIVLFLTTLFGLALWIIRAPVWKKALRVQWRGSSWKTTNFDLHRSGGLLANLFLLVISATGIVAAFPQTIAGVLGIVRVEPVRNVEPAAESGTGNAALPIEELLASAQRQVPAGTVRQVRFPDEAGRPASIRLWSPGDLRTDGGSRVYLDPATGRVLQTDTQAVRAASWTWLQWAEQSAAPIHYAEWGGFGLRLVWGLLGLAPFLLFVSGFFMWWHPYRLRRKAAALKATRTREAVAA